MKYKIYDKIYIQKYFDKKNTDYNYIKNILNNQTKLLNINIF